MDLKIRKLDDSAGAKLKEIASKKGMGVETLARQILTDFALAPEIRNLDDKYRNLAEKMIMLYHSRLDEERECIKDNNYLMERILRVLDSNDE